MGIHTSSIWAILKLAYGRSVRFYTSYIPSERRTAGISLNNAISAVYLFPLVCLCTVQMYPERRAQTLIEKHELFHRVEMVAQSNEQAERTAI